MVKITTNLVPFLNETNKNYKLYLKKEKEDGSFEETEVKDVFQKNQTENFQESEIEIQSPPSPPNFTLPTINNNIFPSLTLQRDETIKLKINETYQEPGYSATDEIEGNITDKVTITSNLDITKTGTYQIEYSITNILGNTIVKTRTIIVEPEDKTPPIISLNGLESIELKTGEEYQEAGYVAIDDIDGDITDKVIITNNINYNKVGTYTIIYTVTDKAGNTTTKNRTVIITNANTDFVINLDESKEIKPKGKSGKRIKRKSKYDKTSYVCKDSRALNFSSIGKHKESLCVYPKKEEKIEKEENKKLDFAKQNPAKEVNDLTLSNPSLEEILKKLAELQKEKKEKKKPKILLQSTCLKISSTERVLKRNSKDKVSVEKLQSFLKKYGYLNGRIDGAFGTITKSALQNFQSDNKLASDGIAGKQTLKYIDKNCRKIKSKSFWKRYKTHLF